MALFKDRQQAGQLLAKALNEYKKEEVVILGLPRGGIVTAAVIASYLQAPLDMAQAQKIGHPQMGEYAIAAISEGGHLVGNPRELKLVDPDWLEKKKAEALAGMKARRDRYVQGRPKPVLKNKTVILVDDGIATGLTMQAAIQEVRSLHPKKLIVVVPVAPQATASKLQAQADQLVSLRIDPDERFLGAVGAYYDRFRQVTDEEVIELLRRQ